MPDCPPGLPVCNNRQVSLRGRLVWAYPLLAVKGQHAGYPIGRAHVTATHARGAETIVSVGLALTRARSTKKERRALEHNAEAAAAVLKKPSRHNVRVGRLTLTL